MIGVVFALAMLWKLRSPDFLSGGFFEYTLLVDPRFEPVSRMLGATAGHLAANRDVVAQAVSAVLAGTPGIESFARILTAGTLAIEGTIAVAWLLPGRLRAFHPPHPGRIRDHNLCAGPSGRNRIRAARHGHRHHRRPASAPPLRAGAAALFAYAIVWNTLVL